MLAQILETPDPSAARPTADTAPSSGAPHPSWAALPWRWVSADWLNALAPEWIAALSLSALAQLSRLSCAGLSPDFVRALSPLQLAALFHVEALSPSAVAALTPQQVRALPQIGRWIGADWINALDDAALAALTPDQLGDLDVCTLAGLSPRVLQIMSTEQRDALSVPVMSDAAPQPSPTGTGPLADGLGEVAVAPASGADAAVAQGIELPVLTAEFEPDGAIGHPVDSTAEARAVDAVTPFPAATESPGLMATPEDEWLAHGLEPLDGDMAGDLGGSTMPILNEFQAPAPMAVMLDPRLKPRAAHAGAVSRPRPPDQRNGHGRPAASRSMAARWRAMSGPPRVAARLARCAGGTWVGRDLAGWSAWPPDDAAPARLTVIGHADVRALTGSGGGAPPGSGCGAVWPRTSALAAPPGGRTPADAGRTCVPAGRAAHGQDGAAPPGTGSPGGRRTAARSGAPGQAGWSMALPGSERAPPGVARRDGACDVRAPVPRPAWRLMAEPVP